MKRLYIQAISTVFAMAALTSCGDFLEETSQDEFAPETIEDYQEILNGQGYDLVTSVDPITHVFTDDVQGSSLPSGYDYYYSEENLAFKDVFAWQPNMCQLLTDKNKESYYSSYQNLYKLIMACNTVLDGIDGHGSTADNDYCQTRGEALALRAYYYWYLVNLYAMPYNMAGTTPDKLAGVPIVKTSDIKDNGPRRNTVAEVYEQITEDIEEACTLLYTSRNTKISNFRINWVAANLLASRIYLYMEDWDKVISHVDKAMESNPSMCNLNGYTLIIPSSYKPNAYNNYREMASNNFISTSFPETIFVGGSNTKVGTSATLIQVSDDLLAMYSSDDLRLEYAFKKVSWGYWGCQEIKVGTSERGYSWRTSELYLNRAEAYANKYAAGDASCGAKAVSDINAIRANRIATASYEPYQLTNADELLQFVKDERRRELCSENPHRWFDLRRYGMPEIKHSWYDNQGNKETFTLEKNDVGYALPIPDEALESNTNLEQNELHAVRVGQ